VRIPLRACLSLLCVAVAAQAFAAEKLIITVSETAGLRRFGYPVEAVLALPRPLTEADHFRLLDGGKPVAAQFRRVGDAKLALDFAVSPGPGEKKAYTVEYGPDVKDGPEPKGGLQVEEADGEFRVKAGGSLVYMVPKDLRGLLASVKTAKSDYLRPGSAGLAWRKADGTDVPVGGAGVRSAVSRKGPTAIALHFDVPAADGGPASTVDLTFPSSKSWVRVDWKVTAGGEPVAALAADVNIAIQARPCLVDFGLPELPYTHLEREKELVRWSWKGGAWEAFRGVGEKPGLLAAGRGPTTGWAHVMDKTRCTALGIAGINAAAGASAADITVHSDGRLQFGRASKGEKQVTFYFHFVPMPAQVGAITTPVAMLAPLEVIPEKK
jgi:hypothetical protein